MIQLGLTGSIGMGKSTVAAMFAARGVPVFDADATVHRLQGSGGVLVGAIEAAFPGTTGADGVDRKKTGRGRARQSRRRSNASRGWFILRLRQDRAQFLARHSTAPLVLFDIPLLFETGGDEHVDKVVVVSAPADVQRERVLARPGMTPERFAAILVRQTLMTSNARVPTS